MTVAVRLIRSFCTLAGVLALTCACSEGVRAQTPTTPTPAPPAPTSPTPPAQTPAPQTPAAVPDTTHPVPVLKPKPKDPDRWAAAVDLGFNASSGNTRLMLLTTGFRLKHRETDHFKLEWGVTYRYGESRGAVVARNIQSNFSFNMSPKATWSPYFLATVERDPFRRLALRSNTGSGVTHMLRQDKGGEIAFSAAVLYSHEGFTGVSQPNRDDARWNIQTREWQKLGNSIRIENTLVYNPVWNRSGDYNMQSLTKLSSKITQYLAMTLSHEYLKDSTPPSGVRQDDQRVQAGLTFEF